MRTPPRPTRAYLPAACAAAGMVCVVVGSFLPWFGSGSVSRNSYQAAALVAGLDLVDNALVEIALRSWVAVPVLCAGCVALYALGLFRTAASCTVVLGTVVGTIGMVCAVQGGEGGSAAGGVAILIAGPGTSAAGAAAAVLGALGVLGTLCRATHVHRRQLREQGKQHSTTGRTGVQP
ncbi:hypothetical protein [Amycolatopsis cihanbeyliensis]|uniref:Uncharacterized protein n=1 Tax=Amycolatopsis cihanbeyliensis TaxID=1128664 RepID=A0A542DCJ7_AMYCI|nr:hypothetical protein [Amycolatopsis cihanbeyliensis]TQJ00783.1 hypothetical protein FB471_0433 [Amycolatopsis cihanbeyliensis]